MVWGSVITVTRNRQVPSDGGAQSGEKEKRNGPANSLSGEALDDLQVKFESHVDRAMIDASLELRKEYPGVVLSSCTRLPDVIIPDGAEYGTAYGTGSLTRWPDGERGISGQLRAIHGWLYPWSDFVIADEPTAEIATRTWIDQYSSPDRRELREKPYYEWLIAEADVNYAVRELNNGNFLPNTCEEYEVAEDQAQQEERMAEKFEVKEGRERNEQQQSRQNTARARSRGDKPPSNEVSRLQDKPFVGKAEREAQQARERRETEI